MVRASLLALHVLLALSLVGCGRGARWTCNDYEPRLFVEIPDNVIEACAKACDKLDDAPSCERASGWLRNRGDYERARELGARACEIEGEDLASCGPTSLVDYAVKKEAYNAELDQIRARLRACREDPTPCEQGCERGDIDACVQLGDMYDLGLGVTGDPERAHTLFSKACEAHDDTRYCRPFVQVFVNPESCWVPDDRPECDDNDDDNACPGPPDPLKGCGEVSPERDMSPAERLRVCNGQRACDAVLERECRLDLASCERACEEGEDAARCRQLGLMHAAGLGVPERHPAKAERYTKRACELGDTHSCEDHYEGTRKLKPNK